MINKKYIKNSYRHLCTILKHKYWVFRYCLKFGLIWRGIKHDFSKFSPTEFLESVKYYTGTSSPIDACKKENGVSYSWMHHKGRNDHHYEYWVDNLDNGGEPIVMPYKAAVEMISDMLGAGRAYNGKSFSYKSELIWWKNKVKTDPCINLSTLYFVSYVFYNLYKKEVGLPHVEITKKSLSAIYKNSLLVSESSYLDLIKMIYNVEDK